MTKSRSTEVQSIEDAAGISISHRAHDWSFARESEAAVDAHWAALVAEKPSLFNGRVLLSRDLGLRDGVLSGIAFTTPYKSFLSWRNFGFPGDAAISNVFAMAALRSSDGAYLLGCMGAGTASAGQLYFPAGTPEPGDVGPDGTIDFDTNILRELEEETGLTSDRIALEPTWTIVFAGPHVACFKAAQLPETADAIVAEVGATIAAQADPELDGLYPVRTLDDLDERRMHPFMLGYLRAKLGGEG